MSDNNDADKRPRMYGKVATSDGSVELTVQGSEGEESEDLSEPFEENLQTLLSAADDLDEESDDKMCQ